MWTEFTSNSPTSGPPGTLVTFTGIDFNFSTVYTGTWIPFAIRLQTNNGGVPGLVGGDDFTGITYVNPTTVTAHVPMGAVAGTAYWIYIREPYGGNNRQLRYDLFPLTQGFLATAPLPAPTITSIAPASGPVAGGTEVMITGTGFVVACGVTVGGAFATVAWDSPTQIRAIVPAGTAGAYDVVVTNPDLQSAILASGYSYADIYSILPTSASLYGGSIVTAYSTGLSAAPYTDTFAGSTLDVGKWANTSSGGSVAVADKLILSVPTTGGTASITSVSTFTNFDISVGFSQVSTVDQYVPAQSYDIQSVKAYIDANNEFAVVNRWDAVSGRIVVVSAKVAGTSRLLYRGSIGQGGSFRIRRFGGTVVASVGASADIVLAGWVTSATNIIIATTAPAGLPKALTATVNSFVPSILVTFGDVMADVVTEFSGGTLQIAVPASQLEGLVPLVAHLPDQSHSLMTDWAYIIDERLSIGGTQKIYTFQDPVLRD